MDYASANINKFINEKLDIIIISDIEGFNPINQIAKITEYASSYDKTKGVIFNGDVLDYTVGIEMLGDLAHTDNLCALKLLKVLTDGMKAGNVICNIGNRDINKIKLLALLQADDNSKWWEFGKTIPEIANKLLSIFKTSTPEKFWKFNDLRSINPFWNKANPNFTNARWLPDTPVIAKTLLERFEYIFGDDPKMGTISAKNNLDGIPLELGIKTTDSEYKAAIVLTVYARMLFMNPNEPNEPNKLEYDGVLTEYLTLANAVSYAILDNTLLLFAHGGFTTKFFSNTNIIATLRSNIQKNKSNIDNEIMNPKAQTGGSFESKMKHIVNFNADVKAIIKNLFDSNPSVKKYILKDEKGVPFLNEDLMILTILSTPATNNKQIAALISPFETALSPIQIGSPIGESLYNSVEATSGTHNVDRVINIFSHIPKGFGYSFGKSGDNSYFINTDFSNTLLKNRKYLKPIETNPTYLVLHLENVKPSNKWQFRLDGVIEMDISSFDTNTGLFDELALKYLDTNYLPNIQKDTILANAKILSENKLKLEFNQPIMLSQLEIQAYPTKNVFYHGVASVNKESYKIYSVNGTAPPFAKHLFLIPSQITLSKRSLGTKKGGSRSQCKRLKSRKSGTKISTRKQNK